jgi:hypothetical protein
MNQNQTGQVGSFTVGEKRVLVYADGSVGVGPCWYEAGRAGSHPHAARDLGISIQALDAKVEEVISDWVAHAPGRLR